MEGFFFLVAGSRQPGGGPHPHTCKRKRHGVSGETTAKKNNKPKQNNQWPFNLPVSLSKEPAETNPTLYLENIGANHGENWKQERECVKHRTRAYLLAKG